MTRMDLSETVSERVFGADISNKRSWRGIIEDGGEVEVGLRFVITSNKR